MSFSIDILKDTLSELEMYQFVEQTKLPQKEYEENVADLKKTIKALESNNFNDFIHSVVCSCCKSNKATICDKCNSDMCVSASGHN